MLDSNSERNTAQRLGALRVVSKTIEVNKEAANRAHKLFKLLHKLELCRFNPVYNHADAIYNAWKYAERVSKKK